MLHDFGNVGIGQCVSAALARKLLAQPCILDGLPDFVPLDSVASYQVSDGCMISDAAVAAGDLPYSLFRETELLADGFQGETLAA